MKLRREKVSKVALAVLFLGLALLLVGCLNNNGANKSQNQQMTEGGTTPPNVDVNLTGIDEELNTTDLNISELDEIDFDVNI
jgi:PBP1b-binding outer membrane lipoprotein LpoB